MTPALQQLIAKCETPLGLLGVLLAACREMASAYGTWVSDPTTAPVTAYWAERAAATVEGLSSAGWLTVEDHKAVEHYFLRTEKGQPDRTECVVEARALAEAVEERFHKELVPLLQEAFAPHRAVGAGDLFPVVRNPHVPAWVGAAGRTAVLTPLPASQDPPVDQLEHFGLGPPKGMLDVEVDVRLRAVACPVPIDRPLRLGVAVLNGSPGELPVVADCPCEGEFLLRDGPANPGSQLEAMRCVLGWADRHRVDVLVFPELCTDPASARQLTAEFDRTTNVGVCVFGSYHGRAADLDWRNTTHARVRGSAVLLTHDKLDRFQLKAKASPTNNDLREGIRTGRGVRVYHGKDWSATLLICKDFMSQTVLPLVTLLRPTLVLVPAYTTKIAALSNAANQLANVVQTVTVLANGPVLGPERVVGVFGVPRTYPAAGNPGHAGAVVQFPQDRTTLPSLCIFDVDVGKELFLP
jgi:predicted amidohydrolase